ncbi:hypothetical protein DEMA109039_03125 [Deinococcus marmoris]
MAESPRTLQVNSVVIEHEVWLALVMVLSHLHLNRLLHLFLNNAKFVHQHGY